MVGPGTLAIARTIGNPGIAASWRFVRATAVQLYTSRRAIIHMLWNSLPQLPRMWSNRLTCLSDSCYWTENEEIESLWAGPKQDLNRDMIEIVLQLRDRGFPSRCAWKTPKWFEQGLNGCRIETMQCSWTGVESWPFGSPEWGLHRNHTKFASWSAGMEINKSSVGMRTWPKWHLKGTLCLFVLFILYWL